MIYKITLYYYNYVFILLNISFFEQIQPQKRQEQSTEYCVWRDLLCKHANVYSKRVCPNNINQPLFLPAKYVTRGVQLGQKTRL